MVEPLDVHNMPRGVIFIVSNVLLLPNLVINPKLIKSM